MEWRKFSFGDISIYTSYRKTEIVFMINTDSLVDFFSMVQKGVVREIAVKSVSRLEKSMRLYGNFTNSELKLPSVKRNKWLRIR